MTDQQKKAVQKAASIRGFGLTSFTRGAEEVLNNPEKYGLVSQELYNDIAEKWKDGVNESARLRSALRTIVNWDDDLEYEHGDPGYFAQEALKGKES